MSSLYQFTGNRKLGPPFTKSQAGLAFNLPTWQVAWNHVSRITIVDAFCSVLYVLFSRPCSKIVKLHRLEPGA